MHALTLLRALPLLLVLLLLAPAAPWAQVADVETGGGQDLNVPAGRGLESRTPSAEPIAPEDVELFVPYEGQVTGRVSIPDDKLGTLVQPDGREWRAFRVQGLFWTGLAVIVATVAALAAFFLWRGPIRIESGRAGRWVPRFGAVERFTHWTTALSFISLALTGLVVTFGRYGLIPLIGHDAYSTLAQASKSLHNWSAPPFVLGIALMLVLWIKDNLPERADLTWIRAGGGMFRKGNHGSFHPETARFNAGQKMIFWAVVLGGAVLAVSGYVLMTPFALTGVSGMQIAHVVHALAAVGLVAVIIAHIYLGTVGMEGAFDAMGRGEVDENWAIEHHKGWYDAQVRGRRAPPAEESGSVPAE